MVDYNISLSVTENVHVEQLTIRQDDTESQNLIVTILNHGKPVNLAGKEVFFNTALPSGYVVREKASVLDASKGVIKYTFTKHSWQDLGLIKAFFTVEKGSEIFSTRNFKYNVIKGIKGCVITGNYIFEWEEMERKWQETLSNIDVNFTDIKKIIAEANARVDILEEALRNADFYTKVEIDKVISDLRTEINEKYLSFKDYKINADNTTSVTMRLDFNNKVMGSNVKNPNGYFYVGASVIKQPNEFLYELANTSVSNSYESLNELDSKAVNSFSLKENVITQHLAKFDAVEVLTRKFSKMFDNKTLSEKVKIARSMIANWTFHVWCKGSGQGGNKVTLRAWGNNSTWDTATSHSKDSYSRLGYDSIQKHYLSDDGNFYFLLNAEASDGIVKSSVQVDYIYLDLVLNVPLNAISFDLHDKVVDLTINDTVVSTVSDVKIKVLNDKLEDVRATLDKKVDVLSQRELLWKGLYMMTLSQRITPTKKMSECQNGWRIKWARYTVSTQTVDEAYCVYQYITAQGSCSVMLPHFGATNEWTMKGLSAVTDTYIQGHDLNNNNNSSGSNYKMVAVAVESF